MKEALLWQWRGRHNWIAVAAFAALAWANGGFAQQPAEDSKQQLDFLRAALQEVQTQRNAALDQVVVIKAQAAAQINALQKQLDEAKGDKAKGDKK